MMTAGDEDDVNEGPAADDDPDAGLTIPAPGLVKPWNLPKPQAPPKTPDDEPKKSDDGETGTPAQQV